MVSQIMGALSALAIVLCLVYVYLDGRAWDRAWGRYDAWRLSHPDAPASRCWAVLRAFVYEEEDKLSPTRLLGRRVK